MHQPHTSEFQPAIYQCADCEVEHNGSRTSLPKGWDRVRDPQSGRVSVRCPDCLERIERDYAAAREALGIGKVTCRVSRPSGWTMGIAAAAFRGQLA